MNRIRGQECRRHKVVAPLSAREAGLTERLADLIRDGRVQLMGVVRQELLSGIRDDERFRRLREYLRAFDDLRVELDDYEEAAQMHNRCRSARDCRIGD